jgi:hypothetical protein
LADLTKVKDPVTPRRNINSVAELKAFAFEKLADLQTWVKTNFPKITEWYAKQSPTDKAAKLMLTAVVAGVVYNIKPDGTLEQA